MAVNIFGNINSNIIYVLFQQLRQLGIHQHIKTACSLYTLD